MANTGKGPNLQDTYLNVLRKDRTPVVIYLTNGVRLKGVIRGFDNFVVLLKENTYALVYKHAISTIVPEREIELDIGVEPQR
ncbi:MAG: RNA chaperone Hfq [Nitrospirota bacterium]